MRTTQTKWLDKAAEFGGKDAERVNQLLIALAFVLFAGFVALAADLWLTSPPEVSVAQAAASAPTLSVPTLQPTMEPALIPTEVPSVTPEPEPSGPVTPPPCVPPVDWGIHTVAEGNTLSSIAQRYGTDVDTLMGVNCLNTLTIFVGQRLYVPGLGTTSPAEPLEVFPTSTPRPGASATPPGLAGTTSGQPAVAPTSQAAVRSNRQQMNIVLLGSDKRPTSGAWRTDSMIVVSVDMQNNIVRLLSIPRDLWVYIPGHGYNRINTADLWGELAKKGGGPERVKQTIQHNLGIPIHYYVRVDFHGFMNIIDTVGGIDVDVDCPLPDINLSAGMHHMNGRQALRYARSRKSTNDFDRGRRQRKVLMALWDQALTLDIIPKLPQLWRSMAGSFQTDLSLEQVINLAYVGAQLKPQRIISRAVGPSLVQGWITPQGAMVLLPREDRMRAMLENFYAPLDASRLDASNKVRVRVVNGSQRREAEQLAAAALRWEGYKVTSTGVAESRNHAQTSILVYTGKVVEAQALAQYLKIPVSAIQDVTGSQSPPGGQDIDMMVTLGGNYNPCQR
ncbi:MAG: LCP family protein [Anaerolineae bacterium]|jgi:LCP family protein required for cell wall assembly